VSLVQGVDGNLYGTTWAGGANNAGTVFKITRAGTLTALHSFDGTDGANPLERLVKATDGNVYGTTYFGGANNAGTVFRITPSRTLTTLYSFCSQANCSDGPWPSSLIQASDRNLYGATDSTFFKITLAGKLTVLHQGHVLGTEGVIQATDGNFYGADDQLGSIVKITPTGTVTTLHSFDGSDGQAPFGLLQATDGNFYGTTSAGGANGYGTVFSLSVGFGPFVRTLPSSGKVGSVVVILGNNLTGATSVTFNGTPATFTVCSTGTSIKTTVPSGATTGKVQVTTPNGTLTSNVDFRVTP
jgi:uncharacterized repeat protein (TIGR03803 family)